MATRNRFTVPGIDQKKAAQVAKTACSNDSCRSSTWS